MTEAAEIESIRQNGIAAARGERIKGLKFKSDYLQRDIDYRTMRTQVAEALVRKKILELGRPDGALNFSDQMGKIRTRVLADLREIYARALAINKGLQLIFGIEAKLPDLASSSFLDDAVEWARSAQNKLARFLRVDQNYVYSVSIAELNSTADFDAGIDGKWRFSLKLTDFPGQLHVRMRGLSAYAEDTANGLYRLEIQPPVRAQVERRGKGMITVDQADVPTCRLGRVGSRLSPRGADVTGADMLHNCSPIGDWEISLDQQQRAMAKKNKLSDIVLNIFVAVQAS